MVCFLHTFGRDLKFNPHLHLLVADGFFDKASEFHVCDISFASRFNKLWRLEVLKELGIYDFDKHGYGFYVWCDDKSLRNNSSVAKYVSRYVRHPIIANGRIVGYDRRAVFFFYKNNNGERAYITKSVGCFISSLAQHIPPAQFKMIRYYGAYARKNRCKYE